MSTVAPVRPLRWFAHGGWYPAVVVLSWGLLLPVPFLHAAARLRTSRAGLVAALYTAALLTLMVTVSVLGGIAGGLYLVLVGAALVHLTALRRHVWTPAAPAPDPAVAAALAARERRDRARRIVTEDPQLARELRIGQPDLARDFDDGGLVDLNSAPAPVIAHLCGIEPGVAQMLVEARLAGGPFLRVDDVFAWADVPYMLWDRIRDRAVVVP